MISQLELESPKAIAKPPKAALLNDKTQLPVQFSLDEGEGADEDLTGLQDRPEPNMRVLLRDSKTQRYLKEGRRWTTDPAEALNFRNGWGATDFAFTMNPERLVIVYEFGDDRYNIRIPVQRYSVEIRQREPRSKRRHARQPARRAMRLAA